jgi:hypothetical protein
MNRVNRIGIFAEIHLPKWEYSIMVEIDAMDGLDFAPLFVKCSSHLTVTRSIGDKVESELTWGKYRVAIFLGWHVSLLGAARKCEQ